MTGKKQLHCYQILLVDDEYFVRQSLLRRLKSLENDDFKVIAEAENGEEALESLEKHDVQIVITDIRMPVMDGLELTKRIHQKYPRILTIILTGYAEFEYAQTAIRHGAFDYLLKPVSEEALDDLLNRTRAALEEYYELPEDKRSALSGEEYVQQAIRYMQEHYMNDIDFGELASEMGFHSAYLARLFGRYAGESPLKYLTGIRIREAKRLLLDTNLPISAVGERVGYPDQFHFSKTFRKVTGENPSSFRKKEKQE